MRTPFATFPHEPTFEEIAAKWPLGGGATDADTVLEQLIQFMWRGDFEERGRPTLFLAGAPEGCDMDAAGTVTRRRPERIGGAPYVLVAPTWSGPGGARNVTEDGRGLPFRRWAIRHDGQWIDSDDPRLSDPAFREEIVRHDCPDEPEEPEAELVASRVCYAYTRADALAEMRAFGFSIEGMTGSPDALFMALASFPLQRYDTDHGIFSTTPRRLRIRLTDLAEWFDTSGLDWPRPAWLSPPLWIPDPTFAVGDAPQPDFHDRKANTIRGIARDLDSQRRDAFLADVIPAIRAGRLAVMARSLQRGRTCGALMPFSPEAIAITLVGLKGAAITEFFLDLLVTREALAAWYRPRGKAPTLDELWPAPDAPDAGSDAAPEETQAADLDAQEEPAPAPALALPLTPTAGKAPTAEEAATAPPPKKGRPPNRGGFGHIDEPLVRKSIKGRRRGAWTSALAAARGLTKEFMASGKRGEISINEDVMVERLRKKIAAAWSDTDT